MSTISIRLEEERMSTVAEATPTLLPVDRPRHRVREASRERFALPLPDSADPLAAVSALIALIARYARAEDVTVFLTTRALAALDAPADTRGWESGAFVSIPMSAEPGLHEVSARLRAAIAAGGARSAVVSDAIVIDIGAPPAHTVDAEFAVFLVPVDDGFRCLLDCDAGLFDRTTIETFATCFSRLLRSSVADHGLPLERIPLLDQDETDQIVRRWNATASPRSGPQFVHRLVEAQAARTPDAVAVEFDGSALTYRSLNAWANRVARVLRERGVTADTTVGISVERSLELPVAILAVLKAGAAFLPLDAELPHERLSFMLVDSSTKLVLTREPVTAVLRSVADSASVEVLHIERPLMESADDVPDPNVDGTPEQLAYVMYTSGSTGRPKGVMIPHRALCNHALWFAQRLDMTAADRMLQHASISFDAAMPELFAPLIIGATVVLADSKAHRDIIAFPEMMQRLRISVAQMVPSALRVAVSHRSFAACTGLRYLVSGGEALDAALASHVRQLLPSLRVGNFYGPTEGTVDATSYEVTGDEDDAMVLPIGKPIANALCRILDSHGALVPVGVPGELCIGGLGLATGYLNLPERTALRFLADPFLTGATLYRSGDLARYRPDGNIEYLGRVDTQVKLRGYRIELAEVEGALLTDRRVRDAAVELREDVPGEQRLVAYVVPADATLTAGHLRDMMRSQLPVWMLPETYCFLDAFPTTVSGKLDRRALPVPDSIAVALDSATPLTDAIERSVQIIWEQVIGQRPIGLDDDFFLLGGHSLKAIRVLAEIERVHGIALRTATLFEAPTIRTLAARVREKTPREVTTIIPVQRGGSLTPLFFVPGGGGELFVFDALAKALGSAQPMYVLDMYVFEELTLPQATMTLADVAARMITDLRQVQPNGPYQLAGYSLGGNIVYEIAQQLTRAGEEVRLLALLDCDGPGYPQLQPFAQRTATHLKHAFGLGGIRGLQYLRKRLGNASRLMRRVQTEDLHLYADQKEAEMVPAHVLKALERAVKPVIRAWERYVPKTYAGSALVIRADIRFEMIGVNDSDPMLGWEPLVLGGVVTEPIAADHFTILHATNAERLAGILTRYLGAGMRMAPPRAAATQSVTSEIVRETPR
jgi:amino acid adenylation domain-containing protein